MNLLIFNYALAAFLFLFSYYLDSHSEKENNIFTTVGMASSFTALFAAIAIHLAYTGNSTLALLMLRLMLLCFSFTVFSLLRFAVSIPYDTNSKFLKALNWIVLLFCGYLVFTGITSFMIWNPLSEQASIHVGSVQAFGVIDSLGLYILVFVIAVPSITVISLLLRVLGMKSRIYRQRLLFVALSICAGLATSWILYRLSFHYFITFLSLPFGLAIMLVLLYQAVSVTTLFDKTLAVASLVNFAVLNFVFSIATAVLTVFIVNRVTALVPMVVLLVLGIVVMLFLREQVSRRMRKYIRVGVDYEAELEAGLDTIDYTSGGEVVVEKTVALLDQYVGCASIDVLVSDDKGKLITVYSSMNMKNELVINENKAIDFLLSYNESVILKTQAITNHLYADVKQNILQILDLGRADAMILLREGHRIVGIILLGPKKRGGDYTDYDHSVLSNLYSNFFLVMYYLKNIANESVVLTVDREIEFSGQVITSIQENIDRVDHEKIDADFITQSARKLGGDFIDFIKLNSEKYLFVMGDVSGKGLNASMSMVILKSVLRTFLRETQDFKHLVIKVNRFVKSNLPKGTFFAGVFGLLDFKTNTLFYINCGVPAMFLYTASYNNAIEIQGDGKVLGFIKNIGQFLKVKKIALNPQDILLMTTDGLIDSTNLRGERFGKDRVQRMLMDNRSYPAGRIAKFLCDNLTEFVSRELEDDITVLVIKYLSK